MNRGSHKSRAQAFQDIRRALKSKNNRQVRAERIAEVIRLAGSYRWLGIYEVIGHEIALVAWSGLEAPTHPRFSISRGLCGAVASSGKTVVVGDVTKDPRYLTTFGSTRSEIVVPVVNRSAGTVLGLIDAESDHLNAFGDRDRVLLERCASRMERLWAGLETADARQPEVAKGIRFFNAQKFFEAHEALESVWLNAEGDEKVFLHGLIQIAAAFHHYTRQNSPGFRSLMEKGLKKLERFGLTKNGIDLEGLRKQLRPWCEYLRGARGASPVQNPPLPRIEATHGD